MTTTTRTLPKAGKTQRIQILVDGIPVGFIEKAPNTRSDQHPWKAFTAVKTEDTDPIFGGTLYQYGSMVATSYGRDGKKACIATLVRLSEVA